jgi:hypothetical protein
MSKTTLKDFMNPSDRRAIGDKPTTHRNCIDATGKARPGKTAKDKANDSTTHR